MRVEKAGIYNMPLADYVADPAPKPSLNAGVAQIIVEQSPLHAWMAHPRLGNGTHDESSRADLGTIAHGLLLENDKSRVVVIQADDWRKKDTQEQRDAARAAGKVPILAKDFATVEKMVEAAEHFLLGSELCEDWMGATPEQTLIFQSGGVWMRSRPDKLTADGKVYFDYKTAQSANPAQFIKAAIRNGYDLQAAVGRRGVQALKGVMPTVVFVVQEIDPPYAVSLVSLSPHFCEIANNRLDMAMHHWSKCLQTNTWQGYTPRVAYMEPPAWYGMDELNMEAA